MMSRNSEKYNHPTKSEVVVLPSLSPTLLLQEDSSKNKQFFNNITLFGNEFLNDQDRGGCIYENLLSGYGKLRKYDENIYENICEDCGRLYNVSKCEFCAPDEDQKKEIKYRSRKFQDFFGSFRIKSSSSLRSRFRSFNSPSSTASVKKKFSKSDIVHNVNGFKDVFKTNKTFDIREISRMQNLKLGASDESLIKRSDEIIFPIKNRSLSDLSDDKSIENIYENLSYSKFDLLKYVGCEDVRNDSLNDWMMSLFCETDDYIDDVVYFVKSIPSKTFSDFPSSANVNCDSLEDEFSYALMVEEFKNNFNENLKTKTVKKEEEEKIEEITITYRDSDYCEDVEEDHLEPIVDKSEFVSGLLDIFEAVLNREKSCLPSISEITSNCNSNLLSVDSRYKRLKKDKKRLVKQNVLLSISLNTVIITYDKYLKLFLMINARNGGEIMRNVEQFNRFFENNYAAIVVPRRRRKKLLSDFLKKSRESNQVKSLSDFEARNQKMENGLKIDDFMKENIYQPIWNCKTQGHLIEDCGENIYDDIKMADDEHEWEVVDDEFSFSKKQQQQQQAAANAIRMKEKLPGDLYKDVCIFYNKNDPSLNKVVYNYDRDFIFKSGKEPKIEDESCQVAGNKNSSNINYSSYSIPDCVQFWKFLLLNVNYLEDEEDVIMTDKTIAILNQTTSSGNESSPDTQHKSSLLLEKLTKAESKNVKDAFLSISQVSFGIGTKVDTKGEFLIERGQEGVYKPFQSNDSLSNHSDKSDREPEKSPPQKRERFRDKLKAKLIDKDKNDGIIFGIELEHVEQDENEGIPKIVIECVRILNDNENIKTHGLYRASGNKNTIEGIKKRLNEKKASKKYEFLRKQEIHSLTGALKLFFRELKSPLIPDDIFHLCTQSDDTTKTKEIINNLNSLNYMTLKYLIRHLKLVDQNSEFNMMTSSNLAIVWGACLFASTLNLMDSYENNDLGRMNKLVKQLIENYQFIFC